MKELYELKEMLLDELKRYGDKKDLSTGGLEVVDKLTHALKNLCKVIEDCEDAYSTADMPHDMPHYRYSYTRGRGRNAKRDAMGRYSREGYSEAADDMIHELRELMEDAPDDRTRQEFQRFIKKIEQM